jgi:uncharacterized protein (DUF2252 family)
MKAEPHAPDAKAAPAERRAFGRAQRKRLALARWAEAPKPDAAGRNPLGWLKASNRGRVPELVPVRHGRMLATPFTFYRGAASLMANDLAKLPHSGIATQLCGDAHLANFGFFASPERSLVFDINDFDETLQGPFDWDVRRLATSFVVAARDLGFKPRVGRDAVRQLAEAYRDRMRRFAQMDTLDAWYARLTSQTLLKLGAQDATELAVIKKARRSTSRVFAEGATKIVKGRLMMREQPPFVYHDAKATEREIRRFRAGLPAFLAQYRASLPPERQRLFDRYELHDVTVLTPGVGSVGRRCFLLLLVADQVHPLFLQCKEAGESVLEAHLGAAPDSGSPGQRVVQGQRLAQAASDVFLGWAEAPGGRGFYVRQLRDMKASYKLEDFKPVDLLEFAEACGYSMARAHAKGGDAWAISGYLGRSKTFNTALADFAEAYADVNQADWRQLKKAAASGKVAAVKAASAAS